VNSVAIATCSALPRGDEDAEPLRRALLARGIKAEWRVWDDPAVDWSGYDLTVVRSTWDYPADRAAFLGWAGRIRELHNPGPVLVWNTDKTYLRDLEQAGQPIVPTRWAEPGRAIGALGAPDAPAGEFVLKPTVGAGSKGVGRFDPRRTGALAAARAHAQALQDAGRTVMVQPYLADVDQAGETALIFFDGAFSHAVTKAAMLPDESVNRLDTGYSDSLFVEERIEPCSPSPAELALAGSVLEVVGARFGPLLYARVDLLPTPAGPVLIELELTEPSLFLSYEPAAADRLAAAIATRIGAAREAGI